METISQRLIIKLNFNNIKNKYINHLTKWKTLKN